MKNLMVLIKGAGEMGTGVAHRLASSHFQVCLTEITHPQAVRRLVAFSEAVYDGEKEVEGIVAKAVSSPDEVLRLWKEGRIPLLIDPQAKIKDAVKFDVVVDAILAKRNTGTQLSDAPLVIALGPGFRAGADVHAIIETNRGHNLGRVILKGEAEPNTGIPGEIGGFTEERVLRAPQAGRLSVLKDLGAPVAHDEVVATVEGAPVKAKIKGVLRGLLRDGMTVEKGMKLGDIDPRGKREFCYTISDKALAIAGGVLEAILMRYNT